MIVVFAIVLVALALFVTEPLPIDVIAIGVLFTLVVLEPFTGVDSTTGISGFASTATVTVLAMFILSEGIRQTGLINLLGKKIATSFGDSQFKQLLAVLGLSGGTAGFINNTPVVAVMIPMITEISDRTGISPSKLLMPASFAAMLGGMLTVIGTSTNILASDIVARIGQEEGIESLSAFSMFEFTQLGLLVLVTGVLYLIIAGPYLVPERIKMDDALTAEFEMTQYLTEVVVKSDSPFVGKTVDECFSTLDMDADIVQLIRNKRAFSEPLAPKEVRADDILVLRTDRDSLLRLMEEEGLTFAPDAEVTDTLLDADEPRIDESTDQRLVEIVITPDSPIIGGTLETIRFRQRYDATVLAIRRGGKIIHARMDERRLRGGDTLLVQAAEDTVQRFIDDRHFIVAQDLTPPTYQYHKIPLAVGIIAAVVGLAAVEVLPIVISAIGGIIAMVATGCVRPNEMYDAVDWSVIFLLAGLIPLGIALEQSGAAEWMATAIVLFSVNIDPVIVLALFYLVTAVVTNVLSNNASVVVMIPVAVEAALQLGANPFAFALAVTFAASTPFLTPIGYQTNLMVYGPGGYTFGDYAKVGAPLQLILTVVTTLGIVAIWGV
ncbi:SLC13 family permease [Natronocalculus amylovorans]|uniref:SLC13 family permease n=1 Tax=Natronocalculus amylovorans TaxID=2917812 RepID=A0AAE3G2T3_9EURY|nr:SLC13 family permease [Natronocalculus amylovorans]MCL9818524.1 SLC13 family permease [Natronocalculus amylovorans]